MAKSDEEPPVEVTRLENGLVKVEIDSQVVGLALDALRTLLAAHTSGLKGEMRAGLNLAYQLSYGALWLSWLSTLSEMERQQMEAIAARFAIGIQAGPPVN